MPPVRTETDAAGVLQQDFYEHLAGDAIDEAIAALLAAIVNFTPKRTRALLKVAAEKTDLLYKAGVEKTLDRINQEDLQQTLETALDKRIDAALAKLSTLPTSASSSPAGSESIPEE